MVDHAHDVEGDDDLDDADESALETDEIAQVEVERMPNLGGFEFYKAIDVEHGTDRWVTALRYVAHHPKHRAPAVEFALWIDPEKEPIASGAWPTTGTDTRSGWARRVRDAVAVRPLNELDDAARRAVLAEIAERSDPTFADYEDRLEFHIDDEEAPEDDGGDADV